MNRMDRLLAILLELQAKRHLRAEDLAGTFETSKRTIYRDILALCEAGVPIISEPGKGYSLMEGYFLPPLTFSPDEATMLLLGAGVMAGSFDAEYRAAARWAARKITSVLSDSMLEKVRNLESSIYFIAANTPERPAESAILQQLRRAILKQQTVSFRYHARHQESGESETTVREADPYGLVHTDNSWILVAHCHLRHDTRNFRLSRMENVKVLDKTFTRPQQIFQMEKQRTSLTQVVRVLFDQETARWAEENRFFYIVDRQRTPDGLLVTLNVRHEREVLQWVLGWGSHVRVLEPESLRQLVADEAALILKNHQ